MVGTLPSNSTSTTGPMIWMTRPTFSAAMNSFLCSGPGDHFYDLLRDRGLTDLVHVEREPVDHLPRIVGGGVHGRPARPGTAGPGRGRRARSAPGTADGGRNRVPCAPRGPARAAAACAARPRGSGRRRG